MFTWTFPGFGPGRHELQASPGSMFTWDVIFLSLNDFECICHLNLGKLCLSCSIPSEIGGIDVWRCCQMLPVVTLVFPTYRCNHSPRRNHSRFDHNSGIRPVPPFVLFEDSGKRMTVMSFYMSKEIHSLELTWLRGEWPRKEDHFPLQTGGFPLPC